MQRSWVIVLATLPFLQSICYAKSIQVALLNPGGEHWFWQNTIAFMREAADDLNIELEVISSNRDHLLSIEQVRKLVNRKTPPDYIITGNEKSNADTIIDIANKAGVKVFLFNNGFVTPEDINKMGKPRVKYRNWIGQLLPNNFNAGYQIGKKLITQGLAQGVIVPDSKANMVAIAGTFATHASTERLKGLKQAVAEFSNDINLLQVLHSDWCYEKANALSKAIFFRHENVKLIWGANDSIALGAMDAAISSAKKPGRDVLIAGCGWHMPALEKVQQGRIVTSVGGHFMDGAWSLVMIY